MLNKRNDPDPLALPRALLWALPLCTAMWAVLCLIVWVVIKVIGG
jgi:hypothetical protein